jgi:hypothetical protein
VVPSFYEGFSFPIVEAMHFGVPIAASNASSLPEVAGEAALYFDPADCDEMAKTIGRLLGSRSERQRIIDVGRTRIEHFSETRSAKELIATYRDLARPPQNLSNRRGRIAYVSRMPAAKTGVARYSRDLLPHLMKHFDIDVYCQGPCATPNSHLAAHALEDYPPSAELYDLTIYEMGNSQFHDGIYGLMANYPGITFLHDCNLHDFIYHRALVWREDPLGYEMELATQYGVEGLRLARIVESAGLSPETAYGKPLFLTAVFSSRMLVLTSDSVPDDFRDVWNVPVDCIPLGIEVESI